MPLIVESLREASCQDQQDLQKIFHDAPPWLFTPFADAQSLINETLLQSCWVVGRFNDRLLCAARVRREGHAWKLSHLCVRKQTRRRGLAARLIEETRLMAESAGCELHLFAPPGQPEAMALAHKTGLQLSV